MRRIQAARTVGAVVALALLGCGAHARSTGGGPRGADDPPGPDGGPSPAVVVQMTERLTFEPNVVEVPRGSWVLWQNASAMMHTVTGDPASARNKNDVILPEGAKPWGSRSLAPSEFYSHPFDVPGTYRYFCALHEGSGMIGTVVVR